MSNTMTLSVTQCVQYYCAQFVDTLATMATLVLHYNVAQGSRGTMQKRQCTPACHPEGKNN
eukprot:1513547-Amphidinium_carterae.3